MGADQANRRRRAGAEWVLFRRHPRLQQHSLSTRPLVGGLGRGPPALGVIGAALTRREDARFVAGRATFIDDIAPPGAAHVAFVRSPHAHAEIVGVHLPGGAPGLVAVLAAADLDGLVRPFPVQAVDGAPAGR